MRGWRRAAALGLLSVLTVTGCNGITLDSRWRDRDILIDGDPTEWYNATTYFEAEKVALGVMNDASHLYLALTSADRAAQMQVLAGGFTVWFDPGGGKDKGLGIRFPVGMAAGDRPDVEALIANLETGNPVLEILTGDETRRTTVYQEPDLAVSLGEVNGALIYELKVPLRGASVSVNAAPGAVIAVKLETATVTPEGMGHGPGPGTGPGSDGDFGGVEDGRSPGGPGMGMPGMGPDMPEPIDVWAKVTLASGP